MTGLDIGMAPGLGINDPDALLAKGTQVEVVLKHQPLHLPAASFHLIFQLGVAQAC
jgi:hypothetical protein